MLSFVFLGGRFRMFSSAGSEENANAGKPSEIKLTHKIWMGKRGMGKPSSGAKKIVQILPVFLSEYTLQICEYCQIFGALRERQE